MHLRSYALQNGKRTHVQRFQTTSRFCALNRVFVQAMPFLAKTTTRAVSANPNGAFDTTPPPRGTLAVTIPRCHLSSGLCLCCHPWLLPCPAAVAAFREVLKTLFLEDVSVCQSGAVQQHILLQSTFVELLQNSASQFHSGATHLCSTRLFSNAPRI